MPHALTAVRTIAETIDPQPKTRVRWQLISWSDSHSCWLLGRVGGKMERAIIDPKRPRTQEESEARILRLLANIDKSKRTWDQTRGAFESRNC